MPKHPQMKTSMSAGQWAMLVALSVLWGGSFFFNGVGVKELPPLTFVVGRVSLAAVTLFIVMRALGLKMPGNRPVWLAFFVMGLLNNAVPFTLIVWGQIHVASGVASILNATTPLFTVLVAHGLTRDEKMTPARFVGVVLGVVGVAVMIGEDAVRDLGVDVTAQLAILGAALSYAFAGVYGRRFRGMGITPIATATGQVTASSILLLPVMLVVDQPWTLPVPSLGAIGSIVAIATLSTALAYILYFRLLATAGATNLLLVTFLVPVSAIILGVAALGEVLLPEHMIGMGFIGLGLAAIDGRLWTAMTRRIKRRG